MVVSKIRSPSWEGSRANWFVAETYTIFQDRLCLPLPPSGSSPTPSPSAISLLLKVWSTVSSITQELIRREGSWTQPRTHESESLGVGSRDLVYKHGLNEGGICPPHMMRSATKTAQDAF